MRICMAGFEDTYCKTFNENGFIPAMSPSTAIKPLDIVLCEKNSDIFVRFGPVEESLRGGSLPTITLDQSSDFTEVDLNKREADGKLGFLNKIFKYAGLASGAISAHYQKAATVMTSFQNVTMDGASLEGINLYLKKSEFVPDSWLQKELNNPKWEITAIIHEIIKSNSFVVAAFDESGASLDVDFNAIQKEVEVTGHISATKGASYSICYKGDTPRTIAFKAIKVIIDKGKLTPVFENVVHRTGTGGAQRGGKKLHRAAAGTWTTKKIVPLKPTPNKLYEIVDYQPE